MIQIAIPVTFTDNTDLMTLNKESLEDLPANVQIPTGIVIGWQVILIKVDKHFLGRSQTSIVQDENVMPIGTEDNQHLAIGGEVTYTAVWTVHILN